MTREHLTEGEQLALYASNGSVTRQSRLESHVARCDTCRARLDALSRLDATLAEWRAPEPPRDGLARVMQRIAEQPRAVVRPTDLRGVVAILAGVLFGAGLIGLSGARFSALPLLAQLPLTDPLIHLAGLGLAMVAFFGVGSLVTLALAPMLILELQSRQAARPMLGHLGARFLPPT